MGKIIAAVLLGACCLIAFLPAQYMPPAGGSGLPIIVGGTPLGTATSLELDHGTNVTLSSSITGGAAAITINATGGGGIVGGTCPGLEVMNSLNTSGIPSCITPWGGAYGDPNGPSWTTFGTVRDAAQATGSYYFRVKGGDGFSGIYTTPPAGAFTITVRLKTFVQNGGNGY